MRFPFHSVNHPKGRETNFTDLGDADLPPLLVRVLVQNLAQIRFGRTPNFSLRFLL